MKSYDTLCLFSPACYDYNMDPNTSQSIPPGQNIPQQGMQSDISQQIPVQGTQPVIQPSVQEPPSLITPSGKESNPILTNVGNEFASNPDVTLDSEVAAAGVEVNPSPEAVITPGAKEAGMAIEKAATTVTQNPTLVKLPLQPEEVNSIVKAPHKVFTKSVIWLATLIHKVLVKQAAEQEQKGTV